MISANENSILHIGKLSLRDIDFQSCFLFVLDQIRNTCTILYVLAIDLPNELSITMVKLSRVEYHSHLCNAIAKRICDFYSWPSIRWKICRRYGSTEGKCWHSWSVISIYAYSCAHIQSTRNNWLTWFIFERVLIEHWGHFEDSVSLRLYSYCVGQILADRNHICITVKLILQDDLHADAEDGSWLSRDSDEYGPMEIGIELESVSFGNDSNGVLRVGIFYNTAELNNPRDGIDVDSDLFDILVWVSIFINFHFTWHQTIF